MENKKEKNDNSPLYFFYEMFSTVVMSIIVIVLIFTFFISSVLVDGISMNPTFNDKDRVIIWSFPHEIKRGDIAIITYKGYSKPLVKRVIAIGGDEVDINPTTKEVHVNGKLVEEYYLDDPTWGDNESWPVPDDAVKYPLIVPDNQIFFMGDNRSHSSDSRNLSIGCVDVRNVIGTYLFPFWISKK